MDPKIEKLKERVVGTGSKNKMTELTPIMAMIREFGGLGELLGREFEVFDLEGDLIYTIKQKQMSISQLQTLIKEFINLKKLDNDRDSKSMKINRKGGLNKLRK